MNYTFTMLGRVTRLFNSRIAQGLLLGILCGLIVYLASTLGWMNGLERGALDGMFRVRGRLYPSRHVVIVEADEGTVARFGRWPLPREVYARVIRNLNQAGAKTIAFDVQFSVPSDRPDEDRALIAACRDAGNVIQTAVFFIPGVPGAATFDTVSSSLDSRTDRFRLDNRIQDPETFGLDAASGTAAIGSLLDTAAALGHVTVYPEWDGALRRIPHFIRYKGDAYPSLALASAAHFLDTKPQDIILTDGAVHVANRRIPLNETGEALVNWTGPTGTIPTYTFQQVLADNEAERLPPETFKDAVVLIGITHPGAYERYATPFSPNQPAVELQANALDNILENRALREAPAWMSVLLLFGVALFSGVLTSQRGARYGALGMTLIVILLWAGAAFILTRGLLYVQVAAPMVAALLTCSATIGYRQLRDARDLKVAEERYALAARGANDGIWDWNLITNEMYYSQRWQAMVGVQKLAPSLDEWLSRVHPDDVIRVETELQRHLNGATDQFENEHRLRHDDGTYRWVLSRGLRVLEGDTPTRIAGSLTDITNRKSAEEELLHNAFYDTLTDLPNRALFIDRLGRAIARAQRHPDYLFAVLFLDIDRFKNINDSLGHTIGDQLLLSFAQRLEVCLRPGDTAARLGGDEFTLLLDDISDIEDATRVAERIQEELSKPFDLDGHEVFTGVSSGIVISSDRGKTTLYVEPEEMLRDADTALYRAKAMGRGRHEIFDETMHARAVSLLRLEADLRRALENNDFRVFYQPIVSLETGRVCGFEALARWEHFERGMVTPGEFMALAEETGLVIPIDKWVLREACRQTRIWHKQFGIPTESDRDDLTISVNLSSKHFSQANLAHQVERELHALDFPAHRLRLEITESVIMDNVDSAAVVLHELKALGVQLAIDDFGTGYSSLSYLHRLPLDILKIDRSFIVRIGHEAETTEIVRAIVTLARSLNLTVVAEGVETENQLEYVKSMGCDLGQGYLFSQPLDKVGTTEYLAAHLAAMDGAAAGETADSVSIS